MHFLEAASKPKSIIKPALNNTTENHTNRGPDNAAKCRYYDIEEI